MNHSESRDFWNGLVHFLNQRRGALARGPAGYSIRARPIPYPTPGFDTTPVQVLSVSPCDGSFGFWRIKAGLSPDSQVPPGISGADADAMGISSAFWRLQWKTGEATYVAECDVVVAGNAWAVECDSFDLWLQIGSSQPSAPGGRLFATASATPISGAQQASYQARRTLSASLTAGNPVTVRVPSFAQTVSVYADHSLGGPPVTQGQWFMEFLDGAGNVVGRQDMAVNIPPTVYPMPLPNSTASVRFGMPPAAAYGIGITAVFNLGL